jgi:predicted nuclease of restriction endonuclease-like RecB superfamily
VLTGPLLRARRQGDVLEPGWIVPTRRDLREVAETMIAVVSDAATRHERRGALEETLAEVGADHRARKVIDGLRKLLLDRCTFARGTEVDPAALRAAVFAAAAARPPLALPGDPLGRATAADVLAEIGPAFGLDGAGAAEALYADLEEQARLTGFDAPTPQGLLERYNLALAQGLLLKATQVRLRLTAPTVGRARQLLRWVRFCRLMATARREGADLLFDIDGPASILGPSTRYGLGLAQLLPGVALQSGPWRLDAQIAMDRLRPPARLCLTHDLGLVSPAPDTGAWQTPEQKALLERLAAQPIPGWRVLEEPAALTLRNGFVVLPDVSFAADDGRTAHLELVGFWRKAWADRHLETIVAHGPGNLGLAVSTKLAMQDSEVPSDPRVLRYATVLPVKAVAGWLASLPAVDDPSPSDPT